MDEFQGSTDRFLAWFKDIGGEFRDDLLEVRDLRSRGAGRGIIAAKDIPKDCTLFTIPRDAIINVQTSELPKKLPDVFDGSLPSINEGNEPLDNWGSLILVMLYEYLQGEASRWKPYFDVLPRQFDTPLFWTDAELKELKGTCLTAEKIGKEESDSMLRQRILPIVQQNLHIFYPKGATRLSEDELLALTHRMGSTIMAYAFDLEPENEEEEEAEEDGWVEDREGQNMLGMVPMADMLNANADFNAHVNHAENLEVTTLRSDLKTGDEILNYYGPLPSSELLRRYGYVTRQHSRYDVAEIPWEVVRTFLNSHLVLSDEEMKSINAQLDKDEMEDYFIIERDSGVPDEQGRLTYPAKLREVSQELEEQIKDFLKVAKRVNASLIPEKRKRDILCDTVIVEALEKKLAQYPTTVLEDVALLKKADLSKRYRMAIEVRLGEKRLLQEAIALVRGTGEEQSEEDEYRTAKRIKI